ncbi:MAG: hypothetical protein ACREFD_11430, partial [Stellaceae bacterium]
IGSLVSMRRLPDLVLVIALIWVIFYCFEGNYHRIGGDLLPIVDAAARNMSRGVNPYFADYSSITKNPFFYLPLQWLPYIPTAVVDVDPRIANIFLFSVIVLFARFQKGESLNKIRVALFPVLFSHLFTLALARTYMVPYWAILYFFTFTLVTRRDVLSAIFLGLALATRQTAVFIAAATLVGIIWHQPLRRTLRWGAIIVVVSGLFLGPFLVWNRMFLYETFIILPKEAIARNAHNPIASAQVGIMPLLRDIGFFASSFIIQGGAGAVALCIIIVKRSESRAAVAAGAGAIGLLISVSGGQVFEYYFGSGLLIMACALSFSCDATRTAFQQFGELANGAKGHVALLKKF